MGIYGKYDLTKDEPIGNEYYDPFTMEASSKPAMNVTPEANPTMEAAKGGLSGAMSGNPWLAGGMAGLSFYLAKQQQAQRNRELAKEGRIAGIKEPTDMVNQALARYMQAVS